MKIIIPFYKSSYTDKQKYRNNCKLLLTCINSYFYNGNDYQLEVVTNDDSIIELIEKMNKNVIIEKVDEYFFNTYKVGDITSNLASLQTLVKLSVIYNYSIKYNDTFIFIDFDTLFLSKIDFDKYIDSNKCFTLFKHENVINKTIEEMLEFNEDSLKIFNNRKKTWLNSGVIIFNNKSHIELDKCKFIYDDSKVKHSDEYFFNYSDKVEVVDFEPYINVPPVSTDNVILNKGLVHFYNPWYKPYIVTFTNKEIKIGITTDHIIDYIPKDYFEELIGYGYLIHNRYFLHNCFQWWYYYADVMGNIGDMFGDFREYDARYFEHLIEKLF